MAEQWILRQGSKRSGFRYRTASGARVTDAATLARIDALRIPPAWTGVHVATSAHAAVQAWGHDAKGRKQYRYHDASVERASLRKHYRVRALARDLPRIRAAVDRDFRLPGLSKARVAAAVVRLISQGFFRVGSERYAQENRTFGITTLRKRHVTIDGDALVFAYVGKRGVRQRQVVVDRHLARFVETLLASPGPRLFRYRDEDGRWQALTARDVNEYLHDRLGVPYTAKDFRTWGGTLRAATVLAELGAAPSARQARLNVVTAVRLVAAELGNTPAICRASYVHPMVIARYLDAGDVIVPARARATRRHEHYAHAPEERALIAFLDRHFPERRSARAPARAPRRERRADAA
jgi:DNA topoisomerase-1